MMDLMHFVEVRSVKQAMCPVEEEVLDEVDDEDRHENLTEVWEIIKANFYPFYVCDENDKGINN